MWFHVFILNTLKMMIDAAACCCSVHEAAWPCHLCHVFFTVKYIIPDYSFLFHWERIRFLFSWSWDALLYVTSFLTFFYLLYITPSFAGRRRETTHLHEGRSAPASQREKGWSRSRRRRETTVERTAARGTTQERSEGEATLRLPGRRSGKRGRSQTGTSHCLAQVAVSLHLSRILSPCSASFARPSPQGGASLPRGQYGSHLGWRETARGVNRNSGRRVQQCTRSTMFKHREAEVVFKRTFLESVIVGDTTLFSKYETFWHALVSL